MSRYSTVRIGKGSTGCRTRSDRLGRACAGVVWCLGALLCACGESGEISTEPDTGMDAGTEFPRERTPDATTPSMPPLSPSSDSGTSPTAMNPDAPPVCEQACYDYSPQLCVRDPSNRNVCAQCLDNTHCAENPEAVGNRCTVNEIGVGTCGCSEDQDCDGNTSGPFCSENHKRCGCETDADCLAPRRCKLLIGGSDRRLSVCTLPCETSAECGPNHVCDPAVGCRRRITDLDCTDHPFGGSEGSFLCSCRGDSDCTGPNALGPVCTDGTCGSNEEVGCIGRRSGEHLTTHTGFAPYYCGCLDDTDCPDPDRPVCSSARINTVWRFCQPACTSNAECRARSDTSPICRASGECVTCEDDSQCLNENCPFCNASQGRCGQCRSDSDCDNIPVRVCSSRTNRCVECRTNADCVARGREDELLCDTTTNRCEGCLSNADCTEDGEPHCVPIIQKCQPIPRCLSDAACPPAWPTCDLTTMRCT